MHMLGRTAGPEEEQHDERGFEGSDADEEGLEDARESRRRGAAEYIIHRVLPNPHAARQRRRERLEH